MVAYNIYNQVIYDLSIIADVVHAGPNIGLTFVQIIPAHFVHAGFEKKLVSLINGFIDESANQ